MIAHPERNGSVLGNIEIMTSFIKMGCLLQITAGALTGVFKEGPRECAVELLKRGWVSIIASDAHSIHARCPELEPARQEAAKIVGEEEASDMVISRPASIARIHFESSQELVHEINNFADDVTHCNSLSSLFDLHRRQLGSGGHIRKVLYHHFGKMAF